MSALSILADRFAWAFSNSSSWTEGTAYQGANAGNTHPRVGLITFSTLRDSVQWEQMNVTSVQLWVKFGTAGENRRKVLSLCSFWTM